MNVLPFIATAPFKHERIGKRVIKYLISQIVEMNDITHHPDRLVEWAEFIVPVTPTILFLLSLYKS